MSIDRLAPIFSQSAGLPGAAALDEEALRLGAALAYVTERGNLDGFAGSRSERVALMTTIVRRGLVAWDRTKERYLLTPLGEQHLAASSPGAGRTMRPGYAAHGSGARPRSRTLIAALAGTAACLGVVTWVSTGTSMIGLRLVTAPDLSTSAGQPADADRAADRPAGPAPVAPAAAPQQSMAASEPATAAASPARESAGPEPAQQSTSQPPETQPPTAAEAHSDQAARAAGEGPAAPAANDPVNVKTADATPPQGEPKTDTAAKAGPQETAKASSKHHRHYSRSGRGRRNDGTYETARGEEFEQHEWGNPGPGSRYGQGDRATARRPRYVDERYDGGDRGEFPNYFRWRFR